MSPESEPLLSLHAVVRQAMGSNAKSQRDCDLMLGTCVAKPRREGALRARGA
jgi:hypothetical protein